MTAGRSKTPARVQVFYFEKPKPAPTRTLEEMPTEPGALSRVQGAVAAACDDQDEPTIRSEPPGLQPRRQARSARVTPPSRPSARARRQAAATSPTSPTSPTPPDGPVSPDQRDAPSPVGRRRPRPAPAAFTPPDRLSNSAEALEYHRRRLQELAARSGSESSRFAELALFGHALFERGRVREAQVVFEGIVAKEPNEALAYTLLGSVFLAMQDEARALALFEAALAIDPSDPAALVARAEIRLGRGQPNFAVGDLERAAAACPGGRDPFGERARALLVLARTLARTLR